MTASSLSPQSRGRPVRLAIVVSHPIQYYVPLYRLLARDPRFEVHVFFTWHGGQEPQFDQGFRRVVAWDIPLLEGYSHEAVPNVSRDPGTHRFLGINNPELESRLLAWKPDAVHVTGYSHLSHLRLLRRLHRLGIPTLFRGDSHLLDPPGSWLRSAAKAFVLRRIYRWPAAFLCVGKANRRYYESFGVGSDRLFPSPHTIEVDRFAGNTAQLEAEALSWRRSIGFSDDDWVLLFAGKFEPRKQPVPLTHALLQIPDKQIKLLLVGNGPQDSEIKSAVEASGGRIIQLPFQNQSRMPLVYRLGDCLVLPSSHGETWGLAVNEAIACGRPAIVSDRVGCCEDLIRPKTTGASFPHNDWSSFTDVVECMKSQPWRDRRNALLSTAREFSTEAAINAISATLSALGHLNP